MNPSEIRTHLLAVTKQAYHEGMFAATSGNLSIYDRESGRMYITPSSYPYDIMTEDDIMVIDLDGSILEGKHKPSSEWKMHAAVYRADARVNAIVHTHSPYATAFAINHLPIAPVLYEIIYFLGGDVRVAEGAIPGSPEVGEHCVEALKDRYACLMANHGVLAVGADLGQAFDRAGYIENAAKICALAQSSGTAVVLKPEVVEAVRVHYNVHIK